MLLRFNVNFLKYCKSITAFIYARASHRMVSRLRRRYYINVLSCASAHTLCENLPGTIRDYSKKRVYSFQATTSSRTGATETDKHIIICLYIHTHARARAYYIVLGTYLLCGIVPRGNVMLLISLGSLTNLEKRLNVPRLLLCPYGIYVYYHYYCIHTLQYVIIHPVTIIAAVRLYI